MEFQGSGGIATLIFIVVVIGIILLGFAKKVK